MARAPQPRQTVPLPRWAHPDPPPSPPGLPRRIAPLRDDSRLTNGAAASCLPSPTPHPPAAPLARKREPQLAPDAASSPSPSPSPNFLVVSSGRRFGPPPPPPPTSVIAPVVPAAIDVISPVLPRVAGWRNRFPPWHRHHGDVETPSPSKAARRERSSVDTRGRSSPAANRWLSWSAPDG